MGFGKTLLASALGTLIAFFVAGIIFVLFVIGLIAVSSGGSVEPIEKVSVLQISLNKPVLERGNDNGLNFDFNSFQKKDELYLDFLKRDLEYAAQDEKIGGILLMVGGVSGAPSTLKDLRTLIDNFKSSGKWVLAYGENYTQADYYIASAANEVYMYPTGMFTWNGLNAEVMFFKKLLDNLEVDAQVIRGRDNKYKSAVEPFLYDKMSEPNKEQMKGIMDGVWNEMIGAIVKTRKLNAQKLNLAANELRYVNAKNAVDDGVLDGLKHYDEMMAMVNEKLGVALTEKMPKIDYADYHDLKRDPVAEMPADHAAIALVYAVGEIQSGKGSDDVIGSDRIASALRKARLDEKIKAVVLRVNSPGGSALASDVIWRETELIKQSGKKLIVSMGDYAASGGYYIACSADKIFANPQTITGSIGVFGIIPNFQNMLDHKLGITFDRYETHPHADFFSLSKPFDDFEMQRMNEMIVQIYDDFLLRVSQGRKMDINQVDSVARGRVWTGLDAKRLGLVDELGGLTEALNYAAQEIGVELKDNVKVLPEMQDPFESLFNDVAEAKSDLMLKEMAGSHYPIWKQMKNMMDHPGVYAQLPMVWTWR
jgi:protease-4